MGMSEFYGARNDEESMATIHAAINSGVNLLDTSDMYGPHHNEELVGRAIKGRRNKVILCTKFGIVRDLNDPTKRGVNGRPEYVRACCDASLKRLKVDEIDLYYQHRVDPNVPIEETVGAMSMLVKAGKVRYLGLSEASKKTIQRAAKIYPITALQSEYSLWTRDLEKEIIPTCRELGISLIAYSPLGRGFLTGEIKSPDDFDEDDVRKNHPRFQGENFQKNLALVEKVSAIAKSKGVTPAQLALAWVLCAPCNPIPIPGSKHKKHIQENVDSTKLKLSSAEWQELADICAPEVISGSRLQESMLKLIDKSV